MNYNKQNQFKIVKDNDDLRRRLAHWRFKDLKIVFTNGCFDLIHPGHIDYLSNAKALGDILIIGLNTDASVSRIKGPKRPINNNHFRSTLLSSFNFVDAIVFFDEETPHNLIKRISPDILVKGSDYKVEDIVGYDIVIAKGGKVETLEFLDGFSSSALIEKIKNS